MRLQNGGELSLECIDFIISRLEILFREFVAKSTTDGLDQHEEHASQDVLSALILLSCIHDAIVDLQDVSASSLSPPVIDSGSVGRPRFQIAKQQLQYLADNHFTVAQMSQLIGISKRIIERRLHEYISIGSMYAVLTDAELAAIVQEIQLEHPLCGNRQMKGHLISRGFKVQQSRIREIQRMVDPEGSIMRRLRTINRQTYAVPAARALWHIDGNHKLIRCGYHSQFSVLEFAK